MQKKPIILRSLLVVATPYVDITQCVAIYGKSGAIYGKSGSANLWLNTLVKEFVLFQFSISPTFYFQSLDKSASLFSYKKQTQYFSTLSKKNSRSRRYTNLYCSAHSKGKKGLFPVLSKQNLNKRNTSVLSQKQSLSCSHMKLYCSAHSKGGAAFFSFSHTLMDASNSRSLSQVL